MLNSEKEIMKGIDDKFQLLMSQFQQNMNILEKNKISSRETYKENIAIENSADKEVKNAHEKPITPSIMKVKQQRKLPASPNPGQEKVKERRGNVQKTVTIQEKKQPQPKKKDKDEESTYKEEAMGSFIKYVSENNDKKKRKKKTQFLDQENIDAVEYLGEKIDNRSNSIATGSKKSARKKKKRISDTASNSSSKNRSNRGVGVVKKPSKTITNISKKLKRRQRIQNTSKDWIELNRINAGKIQRVKQKLQFKNENHEPIKRTHADKLKNKSNNKKEKIVEPQPTIEPSYESIENKLISDFVLQEERNSKNNNKVGSAIKKNGERNKLSFRSGTPLKNIKIIDEIDKSNRNYNRKERINNKLGYTRSLTNTNKDKSEVKYSNDYIAREVSNTRISEKYSTKDRNSRNAYDIERTRSEMKVPTNYSMNVDGIDGYENPKMEMDDFFREIPFVVGRSISRTFNLGLSFQHAMSMLKRIHSKKEVKEVLNIGCPDNQTSENFHCLGTGTCEALYNGSDWTKEDEEAWEQNPWDPELNRRRPKCTCLPNNCTTLKQVLKQLSSKNPNFNTRSLTALPYTAHRLESEIDMLKRPKLKKAMSQTRTELLRNIRTIQIQLNPVMKF